MSVTDGIGQTQCSFEHYLVFYLNLSDCLMAVEALLYNLLVLGSALRCMVHKHKSSIQNRNHSINGVGG